MLILEGKNASCCFTSHFKTSINEALFNSCCAIIQPSKLLKHQGCSVTSIINHIHHLKGWIIKAFSTSAIDLLGQKP